MGAHFGMAEMHSWTGWWLAGWHDFYILLVVVLAAYGAFALTRDTAALWMRRRDRRRTVDIVPSGQPRP